MGEVWLGILLVVVLFALLGSGVWVAFSLFGVGLVAMELFTSSPVGRVLATSVWGASNSWALAALPLFIWMGEILFRSRLSEDLFGGLAPWMGRMPGRLMHVNILGCSIFAAVSGSSAATAATIGRMSLPELTRRGYDETMSIGTLAGSGTLGLLIPPSIILIVYGVAIEESIARLFVAGILPGLVLVVLFMGYVALWSTLHPERTPPRDPAVPLRQRIWQSRRLIPVVLLIVGVIGSIYVGIASPTDAAAVGVFLALLLSWLSGTLTRKSFADGLMGATRTSCMIAFILAGASFLTSAMGFTGIPRMLAEWIATQGLSTYGLLAALTVFFVVLGCFLDGISLVVLTTAVILPVVEAAGIDRIWFGIYLVVVVEMSQITPPVGFNLFVLQGLTGRNILQVAKAALPFFCILVLGVVLLVAFPQLALWLPDLMAQMQN
ncbi:TRAP transporter large permease [Rhodovibrio salinarum]|uniref:TRAP transporter large permease protein n=1 Tax=Rhodovibrio salinarum TaxID=1087 RepID=A0A934QLF5_9PROT|nr:TRAP transporter large permease subunit [Rhodovibrio salinarum]MBK1698765.1 C4-dicarboxylate ABC transporter permease [Rhodovibrio salinarum]